MYVYRTILFVIATVPVLTSVTKNDEELCRWSEHKCGDGQCLPLDHKCDGISQCLDGSDEADCGTVGDRMIDKKPILNRIKRQANRCRRDQWQCRDGSCIGFDGKCDGVVDCKDGSDETHPLCRSNKCQSNWFRCTYGACVDGTAPCNGIQECADNSDELLPRCRNVSIEVNGQFKCDNGEMIPASSHCDGVADCSDGSDENIKACAGKTCYSYLFQCAYGACVDSGADCNNKQECADGSDESDELCNRSGGGTVTQPGPVVTPTPQTTSGKCTLPPFPAHGRYTVMNAPNASPGQSGDLYVLNVTCYQGYGLMGDSQVFCAEGTWTPEKLPECKRFCKLNRHPSVEHSCRFSIGGTEGSRPCNNYEPPGTVAWPECVKPNYFFLGELPSMRCGDDGSWDNNPTCTPGLVKNGTNITILIKDKVEVHVSYFQYASSNIKHSVPDDNDYDIDESDWRIGPPVRTTTVTVRNREINKPVNLGTIVKSGGTTVKFKNGSVVIDTDDGRIHFRD